MMSRSPRRFTILHPLRRLLALLGFAMVTWHAISSFAAPPSQRARPPQFDQSVRDVFFPDAREKLTGPRPAKTARGVSRDGSSEASSPLPKAEGKRYAWSRLIAAEVVEDEIKAQQILLAKVAHSATRFKGGGYQQARVHFSVLAVLFALDGQYDQTMRWQHEAPALRDLLAEAGLHCKAGSDATYHETQARAEDLLNLVRGGSLSLAEAPADFNWAQVAERPPLMKRLEQAQEKILTPGTANAGEFSRQADKLSHEAQIIAALSEVIAGEGYEYADDETYREFARTMQQQALAARDAVEQKDYEAARAAVAEMGKACNHCHEGFRN